MDDEGGLSETGTEQEELEQSSDSLVDILTGREILNPSEKEHALQHMIQVLGAEYHFPLEAMERDVNIPIQTADGKRRKRTADLVIYAPGQPHTLDHAQRIVVVQAPGTKPTDQNRGVGLLEDLLNWVVPCEFGLWTNGRDVAYIRKIESPLQANFVELSDFPGMGESLEDIDRPDRRIPRVAVQEDLRQMVLRCHDYLYGNQAMTAPRAFSEMVKLIFAKICDEQQVRASTSYKRQFWVGITERIEKVGQEAISARIKALFEQVKREPTLEGLFRPGDEIEMEPRQLAWVATEIARYNFLDADVDVKGMAYEAMVATTMKRERGQFFTPSNVVQAMVEMLAPQPNERVLDPACGSGRFLVACLDRYRHRRAEKRGEESGASSEAALKRLRNRKDVLEDAARYAGDSLFGIDLDPELQRAAKMNMVLNNDGHGNLYVANSLTISPTDIALKEFRGAEYFLFESFDVVLTDPPFGTKIPIDDPAVLRQYDLAHQWIRAEDGVWVKQESALRAKMPPEILFIERCMQWLKPGGRMGIVVPDGILGNPGNEYICAWILRHARVLASIDLPVEAFLPQVGVQASLLFLQKKKAREVAGGGVGDYPIFMAVAEFVGHDRRGKDIYRRDADGYELYETYDVELTALRDGQPVTETRQLRRKQVADDLPIIAHAYREWRDHGIQPSARDRQTR